jgi:hypothetical protein
VQWVQSGGQTLQQSRKIAGFAQRGDHHGQFV